jgi:glycosyltransferase involved in cell wall biosynthesis
MARILHVLASPRAEGTPRLVLDWLSVPGHQQAVVFLARAPVDLLDAFRKTGCVVHEGDGPARGIGKVRSVLSIVSAHVRANEPDVVVAWPLGYSHWVFLGARLAGSRAALLSHGGNPPDSAWFGRYVRTWVCLWTTALCRGRMVACSRYVERQFLSLPLVPESAVAFAYNSVRTEPFAADTGRRSAGPRERPFRATMVATLEAHKDHATLIRAARVLKDRGVALEVWLVGAGSLDGVLRALASGLGVEGSVRFLGSRSDVPDLLGDSDLFVLSTTGQEGRPGVVLEALAAGLCVVASDVEPLREVLEDGRWGDLVAVGDPAALADAIERASRAGPLPAEAVAARRSHAAQFSPARMISDYLSLAGIVLPVPKPLPEPLSAD